MSPIIFLMACMIYHEDRSGDLTSHWALGHALLVRWAQQGRYPETIQDILRQRAQFPWVHNLPVQCRRPTKKGPDQVAWDVIMEQSQLIWNARDTVWHNYSCFYNPYLRPRYPIAVGAHSHKYGHHIFWEC